VNQENKQLIMICSDSVGETAEAVVQATMRQFEANQVRVKRISHISSEDEIVQIVEEACTYQTFIAYTLVQPELREMMRKEAIRQGVRAVDIMGPVMQAFIDTFNDRPFYKPGLLHQLDEAYYQRVEAIEFAVKYDDGKDARGILQADIVLIGVSRTSKTPLSIFLAHKGIKVANLPLIPEVRVPDELWKINNKVIIGLTMNADNMLRVRTERLKALGLTQDAKYASIQRIEEELDYAEQLMKKLGCYVINVTNRAIEETANQIQQYRQSIQ
jgi:regulator of PEP synthase PpsR (kinase-PPPase family)